MDRPLISACIEASWVVDSGGMGILYIMMGQARVFDEDFDLEAPLEQLDLYIGSTVAEGRSITTGAVDLSTDSIEFGYCTEFFIKNLHPYVKEEDIDKLKTRLERLGDSIVVVAMKI